MLSVTFGRSGVVRDRKGSNGKGLTGFGVWVMFFLHLAADYRGLFTSHVFIISALNNLRTFLYERCTSIKKKSRWLMQ